MEENGAFDFMCHDNLGQFQKRKNRVTILNHKRLRKESRIERLQQQLALMTHIANEYEHALIKIGQVQDKFAYTANPAKEVLWKISRQLGVRR